MHGKEVVGTIDGEQDQGLTILEDGTCWLLPCGVLPTFASHHVVDFAISATRTQEIVGHRVTWATIRQKRIE